MKSREEKRISIREILCLYLDGAWGGGRADRYHRHPRNAAGGPRATSSAIRPRRALQGQLILPGHRLSPQPIRQIQIRPAGEAYPIIEGALRRYSQQRRAGFKGEAK